MNLLQLRAVVFRNSVTSAWVGYALVMAFVLAVVIAEWLLASRALQFLAGYPIVGLAVARNMIETGLVVLVSGVVFSSTTTAITMLYTSDDLNFLLSQPVPAWRVFTLKLLETFLASAAVPFGLVLPMMIAIGQYFEAAIWYYPLAFFVLAILFVLPVAFGAGLAVLLMRLAPAGRVREVATGLGVLLSAGLVYFIRAAKPEDLLRQIADPNKFDELLLKWAAPQNPFLPPAWAARVVWEGAKGEISLSIVPLTILATGLLGGAAWLAAKAYQEGWVRGLESSVVKLNPTPLPPSFFEKYFASFGALGQIIVKDARLLFRDATQWSQLLILVALGAVYVVSVRALPLEGDMFRNAIGFLTLAFQGFVIAGVGIRMAFPSVSLEGHGYWLLRTGPVRAQDVVSAKFVGALPPTFFLALMLGLVSALALQLTPTITLLSVLVAASCALVMTALGVGIGAAMPRFKADNASEIAISPGALIYMMLSLFYSGLLVVVAARPAFLSITKSKLFPGLSYFSTPEGWLVLGIFVVATVLGTVAPLVYGSVKLDQHE